MNYILKIILALIFISILSKEVLILDEHTILIVAFFVFFLSIYDALSSYFSFVLNERAKSIQDLTSLNFNVKKELLLELRDSYSKLSSSEYFVLSIFQWSTQLLSLEKGLNSSLARFSDALLQIFLNLILKEQRSFSKELYNSTITKILTSVELELVNQSEDLLVDKLN